MRGFNQLKILTRWRYNVAQLSDEFQHCCPLYGRTIRFPVKGVGSYQKNCARQNSKKKKLAKVRPLRKSPTLAKKILQPQSYQKKSCIKRNCPLLPGDLMVRTLLLLLQITVRTDHEGALLYEVLLVQLSSKKNPASSCTPFVCARLAQLVRSHDCQPEGPRFNPRPGRGLNFWRPSFAKPSVDRDVKPLV